MGSMVGTQPLTEWTLHPSFLHRHMHTRARTGIDARRCTRVQAHTHTNTCTRTRAGAHMHTHACMCRHPNTPHEPTCTRIYTCTHTLVDKHVQHAQAHMYARACTCRHVSSAHAPTGAHTHDTRTHTYICTRKLIDKHMHTQARTHTHTHTGALCNYIAL